MSETSAPQNVYDFITSEKTNYETLGVQIADNYEWQMKKHIDTSVLYKHSQYAEHIKTADEPFRNIVLPMVRLQYRSEGFDVKDIELFVDEAKNYYKSFLIKKWHERWARENGIDTFIDEMVESYVDFGGALVKDVNDVRPEVVPLQRIAFCDQTDILAGPICEKHFYSADQLKEMEAKGWGDESNGASGTIDEVITLAKTAKREKSKDNKTPAKYIEVYELHGTFPVEWLEDGYDGEIPDDTEYVRQIHIVTFYKDANDNQKGICLFKKKERKSPYKLVVRDPVYGRALGIGGVEELFEPQVWVNYDTIRVKGMLDQASKVIYQTNDSSVAARNKTTNLDNGDIIEVGEGKEITQLNTQPVNITIFENSVREWDEHAQRIAAATDALLGEAPSAGTPFKLQDLISREGQGIHDYRKGKLATFLDELYQDWFIPRMTQSITEREEFLAELDLDELQTIADQVATNLANRAKNEHILQGGNPDPEEVAAYEQMMKQDFLKTGNKKFIELLREDIKDAPIVVKTNIAGKQKHLSEVTDKLSNIIRTIIAAPQILQSPPMAKLFNQILETSGLDPIDFSNISLPQPDPNTPTATNTPAQPVAAAAQ